MYSSEEDLLRWEKEVEGMEIKSWFQSVSQAASNSFVGVPL